MLHLTKAVRDMSPHDLYLCKNRTISILFSILFAILFEIVIAIRSAIRMRILLLVIGPLIRQQDLHWSHDELFFEPLRLIKVVLKKS